MTQRMKSRGVNQKEKVILARPSSVPSLKSHQQDKPWQSTAKSAKDPEANAKRTEKSQCQRLRIALPGMTILRASRQ